MREFVCVDLPEDRIREYCATQPIQRLSVFGSAARNDLTPDSDIDLLIEYEPNAPVGLFAMSGHRLDLIEIVGRDVDLATPNSLSPHIRDEVLNSAELIYAHDERK